MEAIAGANRGGIAGCSSSRPETITRSASGKRNVLSPSANYYLGSRRGSLRAVRQSSFSSAPLQDESHVQYYQTVLYGVRNDRLTNSVCPKAVAGLDEAVDADRVRDKALMKAKKMEMKMQKKLKKAARDRAGMSSSSSSSSSESEGRKPTEAGARRKRGVDMEKLRRDWDVLSHSPLMNSIPTISSSFVIGQAPAPQQVASPVESMESSFAAQPAEVISAAALMGMRISSSVGSQTDVGSSATHDHGTFMAGIPVAGSPSAQAASMEVCMGGKCKKAGAQEVLSAFHANGVDASACNKCMKKCKFAINVRIHQEGDDVPQMYSGIGIQDVNVLSRKHFGAGAFPREAIQV
ncbi:unnamed protein product [Calypogeia fissa]